jgi:pantoate--beta-alanine ligase
MGALHEGHASLVRRAVEPGVFVVVSIFVNPTQFRPNEDYQRYPRTLEHDHQLCQQAGADLIFAPTVEEMYGSRSYAAGESANSTFVEVPGFSEILEGASRPGHFRGVATVVAKLFHQVKPDIAYFGQKDAQQLAVLRRMVADLCMPIEIVGCPTLREHDGLAMSSRNRYLTPEQRANCIVIYQALNEARERVREGERDAAFLQVVMRGMLDDTPGCEPDYALIVNPETFLQLQSIDGPALALIAARFGTTRLIDNIELMGSVAT